ncbi:broad specificity phosphatase PhoE [Nocardia kruczakiae]|uniref:Broad specificity phosphatase PhoE n=1 Tax=Nocardia kruczakiae TaxID=261477 RepID=A0ABU1XQP5_9NOCA|nr:alpha/beta fold hydrolase [Nocardia kruczakiae]MDR7172846.1 broad specificity phosphatase PhoE [Nocardia kruczakiae]
MCKDDAVEDGFVVLSRHFETSQNVEAIMGLSGPVTITDNGRLQAMNLALSLAESRSQIQEIRSAPTSACIASAELLADLTGLPIGSLVELAPFELGSISGLPEREVARCYPDAWQTLEEFRLQIVDASALLLPGAEDLATLERRIKLWWAEGQDSIHNSILILSRSILLMVNAALTGAWPTSGGYFDLKAPNGGARKWIAKAGGSYSSEAHGRRPSSWPSNGRIESDVDGSTVVATEFYPAYFVRLFTIIIVPGLFGNNRAGPNNLYSAVARHLAGNGYRTITYDPVGAGESTPKARSYDDDVESLLSIMRAVGTKKIVLIGHSVGAAIATAARKQLEFTPAIIAVAPVTTKGAIERLITDPLDLTTLQGSISTRNGLDFRTDYPANIDKLDDVTRFDRIIVGATDTYVDPNSSAMRRHRQHAISIAGNHNFSSTQARSELSSQLLTAVTELAPGWRI